MISISRLKERVAYDPLTGYFTWLKCHDPYWNGMKAGTRCGDYWTIKIDRKALKAHRVAWAITHGEWPDLEIDHRNGNGLDNRLENLRLATHSQNQQNKKLQKNNTGRKGVHFVRAKNAYVARIKKGGKQLCLGYFKNLGDADAAYIAASLRLCGEYSLASSRGATSETA